MSNTIDLILDWMDGILPGLVIFVKDNVRDIKDKNNKKRKVLTITFNIVKVLYLLVSIYTLYHIYFVEKKLYFQVDIRVKLVTTIISIFLLLRPTYYLIKNFNKNKSEK